MKTFLQYMAMTILLALAMSYLIFGGDLFAFWGWIFGTLFNMVF